MSAICDQGRAHGLRHYFLGGAPGVPEALAERLTMALPGLEVVGVLSPRSGRCRTRRTRRSSGPSTRRGRSIYRIGLGSPKQEYWAAEHQDGLNVPVLMPVGAAFNFLSGNVRRAPRWIQRIGMEWLFRLAMEPRRLVRRYAVTNSQFMVGVLRETLQELTTAAAAEGPRPMTTTAARQDQNAAG